MWPQPHSNGAQPLEHEGTELGFGGFVIMKKKKNVSLSAPPPPSDRHFFGGEGGVQNHTPALSRNCSEQLELRLRGVPRPIWLKPFWLKAISCSSLLSRRCELRVVFLWFCKTNFHGTQSQVCVGGRSPTGSVENHPLWSQWGRMRSTASAASKPNHPKPEPLKKNQKVPVSRPPAPRRETMSPDGAASAARQRVVKIEAILATLGEEDGIYPFWLKISFLSFASQ